MIILCMIDMGVIVVSFEQNSSLVAYLSNKTNLLEHTEGYINRKESKTYQSHVNHTQNFGNHHSTSNLPYCGCLHIYIIWTYQYQTAFAER